MSRVMPAIQTQPKTDALNTLKKFSVSAFVVLSFAAYAVHERAATPDSQSSGVIPAAGSSQNSSQNSGAAQTFPTATNVPPTVASASGYKDGQFAGNVADAYFGQVQVLATIQGGKITDVKFLNYPHDRRTSQMINSQAMPWLTQEAIQAQSANVDLISGATLTSNAFIESLTAALNQAKG